MRGGDSQQGLQAVSQAVLHCDGERTVSILITAPSSVTISLHDGVIIDYAVL